MYCRCLMIVVSCVEAERRREGAEKPERNLTGRAVDTDAAVSREVNKGVACRINDLCVGRPAGKVDHVAAAIFRSQRTAEVEALLDGGVINASGHTCA